MSDCALRHCRIFDNLGYNIVAMTKANFTQDSLDLYQVSFKIEKTFRARQIQASN